MSLQAAFPAFGAGLVVAVVTVPVGVSEAVFMLPVQLDVLRIPSPAVTPTNLLLNVVSSYSDVDLRCAGKHCRSVTPINAPPWSRRGCSVVVALLTCDGNRG